MRKLCAVLMVLAMTSTASAGLINLQVDTDTGHGIPPGGWADNNENGIIDASDDIYLTITLPAGTSDGYNLDIDVTGPGTLSEYGGGPLANHALAVSEGMFPMTYSGIGGDGNIDQIMHQDFMGAWAGPIDLVWGLVLHCDGVGPVTLDLTLNGATRVDLGAGWINLEEGDLGNLTIVQVPEPATLVLLGLGGLFLRRRK